MRSIVLSLIALVSATGLCSAGSTVLAHYGMGELEIAGGATVGGTAPSLLATTGPDMTALTGTPTIGAGGPATALGGSTHYMTFDGVQQHYQISPDVIGSGVTNDWMIEAWVRPQAGGSGLGMIVSHGHGGNGQVLNYDADANRYGWYVGHIGQINGTVGASGVGTTWDHLALVRTGNITTLFVNGSPAGSDSSNFTPYADGNGIGSQYTGGGDHGFTGDIDEVYFSTISGTFNAATDLHMTNPPDPVIVGPTEAVDAGTITISTTSNFSVELENAGAANTLTINSVTGLVGDTANFTLVTTLPLDILPGEFGQLEFQYAPGATAASHSASFTIASNDVSNPNLSVTLTGNAISDPNLVVSSTLDFGTVATTLSTSKDLEVINSGANNNLTISAAIVTGTDSAYFTITSAPETIEWDWSDVITVQYNPAGNLGTHTAVLEITHNDPDLPSPVQVTLTGTAIPRFSVIAQYHLGEDDTDLGATTDSAGDYDLTNVNGTPGTSYNAGAGVSGSTKGIDHLINDAYSYNGVPTELVGRNQNWGLQAWFRPELSTGSAQTGAGYGGYYFGVGNGARGGFGIFSFNGSTWGMNIGGISTVNSAVPMIGGAWTHVAIVSLDNQTRLYVNGLLAQTYGGLAYAPNDNPAGQPGQIDLGVANSYQTAGGMDEASIFTFVSGQFDPATDLNVTPPADADGDGLADLWENQYFGGNDGIVVWSDLLVTDGSGDADLDTFTDKQEFDAGTDPRDDTSFPTTEPLAITSISRAGNTATIQFSGVDGNTYVLKKTLTLADGFPTTVDTVTLTGTASGTLEDTNATEAKAFYRVEKP